MDNRLQTNFYYENCANFYSIRRGAPDPADRIPHNIDYYEICMVLSGNLYHQREKDSVILKPGDCYIVPSGFSHSVSNANEDADCFWLSFQESLFFPGYQHNNLYRLFGILGLGSDDKDEGVQMRIELPTEEQHNLKNLFECLLYEFTDVPEKQRNAGPLLIAIIGAIARNYFNNPDVARELTQVDAYSEIMKKCINFIDENYMKPLTISQIAKEFAMSPSSFSIMFPKVAGVPFKQYLNRQRINAALALCANPELPFQQISDMCGYQDVSTFYRNFIKFVGVSPTTYRENIENR